MTTEKRDIFAARLRHELTQETHVVVGDHQPEPRRIGKHPALAAPYGGKLSDLLAQARRGEQLDAYAALARGVRCDIDAQLDAAGLRFTLHNPEPLPPGYTVRVGTMRDDEYLAIGTTIHEAIERDAQVERDNAQVAEYVRPLTVTFDPMITWKTGDDVPRDVAERQLAMYRAAAVALATVTPDDVNRVVEDAPPRLDGPACRCHERMGNDWYFLPSDRCLYDINECRHRRTKKP